MAIVLARIDNRLIHGQVLEAWVPYLKADCIVVANDAAAATPLQRMIMQAAVPGDLRLEIVPLARAAGLVTGPELARRRILLLLASAGDALEACRLGVPFAKLNLGNLQAGAGKCRYNQTIALDEQDIAALRAVADRGVAVVAQCVPADREVGWERLLAGAP